MNLPTLPDRKPDESAQTEAIIGYEDGPRADIALFNGRAVAVLEAPDVDGGHLIGFRGGLEVAKDWCFKFFEQETSITDRDVIYVAAAAWEYGFPYGLRAYAFPLKDGRMLLALASPKCANLDDDPRKFFAVFPDHDEALDWCIDLHFALEPTAGGVQ